MDLINELDLCAVRKWVTLTISKGKGLNKREREMVELLDILLRSTTPYLGSHGRVEMALKKFAEQMCK